MFWARNLAAGRVSIIAGRFDAGKLLDCSLVQILVPAQTPADSRFLSGMTARNARATAEQINAVS
jgi:hypothetical protein